MSKPTAPAKSPARDSALSELLEFLRREQYTFVTPTPATHEIVIGRNPQREGSCLVDIFGWSLPFRRENVDAELFVLLADAAAVVQTGNGLWRSGIRVSALRNNLFIHSAFPTDAYEAVFFGPDSYRFADAIIAELARQQIAPEARILDIGTGSGVGAIVVGNACLDALITMTDINPIALEFAQINTAAAGITARGIVGHDLSGVAGEFDLILANPPYIADPAGRAYRDGGGGHGSGVALTMTEMALPRLSRSGRFLLYTGSAIVGGEDRLHERLCALAEAAGCAMNYRELDPDVFGEELANPAYCDVDRIAVVVAVFTAPAA